MESDADIEAWLQDETGACFPLGESFSIGRASTNSLVLSVKGTSRCHAMIHARSEGGFWLVDLGSRNGTWHNGQRILQPLRLHDGDRIAIAGREYSFHQSSSADDPVLTQMLSTIPLRQTRELPFWLLISDIENFTRLSQELRGSELTELLEGWLRECQSVVEPCGGRINKYLGDGFFAVWPDVAGSEEPVLQSVQKLAAISARGHPAFRLVLHCGVVSVGGSPLLSEESFIGSEVNFVFRMEKLAGSLGLSPLFSRPAADRLSRLLPLRLLAAHRLKGFDGSHDFYTPEPRPS